MLRRLARLGRLAHPLARLWPIPRFSWPTDVLVLPNGDVVVVDNVNARIRLIAGLAASG